MERRAFVLARLGLDDREDALDAVQDAMFRLVRHYAHKPAEEWAPLFFGILRRRIVDLQRRRTVRRRLFAFFDRADDECDMAADVPDPAAATPDDIVARDRALGALGSALRKLPARQQQAFLLRVLEGLDVAQTAAAMGCSEGSVKTHLSRALANLRNLLEEHA